MSNETDASGAQVPCISLLAELSGELDKWLSGANYIPDTVHNRAVRNAVSVVADAVAITRARLEARKSDAERTATNAVRGAAEPRTLDGLVGGSECPG
jgi:phage portal protein BeeE